eukprot:GHVU01013544.1.p2 GENE.GHVU01013544.1~~GHVU01013544.1.p2  ORF type:complete len:110 (-),score=8.05 GHVU01013544.1:97-426(-)
MAARIEEAARARNMAEEVLGDDRLTPAERADRMAAVAQRMGQAARTAEGTGQLIRNPLIQGVQYRGEVRTRRGLGVVRHGLGVVRWPNGSVLSEGEFQTDSEHGLGVSR